MKTTMPMRTIANPRRTTLSHLQDTDEPTGEALELTGTTETDGAVPGSQLPLQTANPRRTVLADAPGPA